MACRGSWKGLVPAGQTTAFTNFRGGSPTPGQSLPAGQPGSDPHADPSPGSSLPSSVSTDARCAEQAGGCSARAREAYGVCTGMNAPGRSYGAEQQTRGRPNPPGHRPPPVQPASGLLRRGRLLGCEADPARDPQGLCQHLCSPGTTSPGHRQDGREVSGVVDASEEAPTLA